MGNEIKETEVTIIDKDMAEKEFKRLENEKNRQAWKENIDNLKIWEQLHKEKIAFLEAEIVLKQKAPMPLKKNFAYEELPEWEEHLKKSAELGIRTELLQIKADLVQVQRQIKVYEGYLEEQGE